MAEQRDQRTPNYSQNPTFNGDMSNDGIGYWLESLQSDFSRMNLQNPAPDNQFFEPPVLNPTYPIRNQADLDFECYLMRLRVSNAAAASQMYLHGRPPLYDLENLVQSQAPSFVPDNSLEFYPNTQFRGPNPLGFYQYGGRRTSNGYDPSISSCNDMIPYYGNNFMYSNGNNYVVPLKRQQKRFNGMQLAELRGKIASTAMSNINGCDFLKMKIDRGNPDDIHMIFLEVLDRLDELMVHHSANILVQKLFGALNDRQMTALIFSVVNSPRKLLRICVDKTGTRVIQKLIGLETLTWDQMTILVAAMKELTLPLSSSFDGHHVIKECFQVLPSILLQEMAEEVAKECVSLAMNQGGCVVVQYCISKADDETKLYMLAQLTANSLIIAQNHFGNYVLQYLLKMKIPQVTTAIINQLRGNYADISRTKGGSHFVERCLEDGDEHAMIIINEFISHPNSVELVSKDCYGNYVIQSVLRAAKGQVRMDLVNIIKSYEETLRDDMYGKRVAEKVREQKQHQHYRRTYP